MREVQDLGKLLPEPWILGEGQSGQNEVTAIGTKVFWQTRGIAGRSSIDSRKKLLQKQKWKDMADKVVHTCNLTMPLKKDLISRRPETSTLQMIKGPIHTNIQ